MKSTWGKTTVVTKTDFLSCPPCPISPLHVHVYFCFCAGGLLGYKETFRVNEKESAFLAMFM